MARGHRPQYAGAIYHLASRGIRGLPIFVDDVDRVMFLGFVEDVVRDRGCTCHAYCLMTNHFHLVMTTSEPNIGCCMQFLLGCYAQWFNRRHGAAGHLLERRYRAKLIESHGHRVMVAGYVLRNPVAAGVCDSAEEWPWSSYAATMGLTELPDFVQPQWILDQFGFEAEVARQRLRALVNNGTLGSDPDGLW